MADRPRIVDTHVHFWDLQRCRYPWLDADDCAALRQDFLPEQLVADADSSVIDAIVHVEAGCDPEVDPVAETAWLDSIRGHLPTSVDLVAVAYADLRSGHLEEVLERHLEFDFVRGIRQEAWFDPTSSLPGVLEIDLLEDDRWLTGLSRLSGRGLSFDLLVAAHQLTRASEVFAELPDLVVVLDHAGVPVLEGGTPPTAWRDGIREFAHRVPQSVMKISGMGFVQPGWSVEQIRPIVLECIEVFGPDRCMFGSNYPVEKPESGYERLWSAFDEITAALGADDREALFAGTARRTYRLAA